MVNYIRKFGIWEYILFIMGVILLSKQTYSYVTDNLEFKALELFVFVGGVLLVASPVFLVRLAKKFGGAISTKFTSKQ